MDFRVFNLGLVDFKKALQLQKETFQEIKNNSFNGALILCRHYPVITAGRQSKTENIKVALSELKNRGIHLYEIERGGDVTYHGPGQLIAYTVFNLNHLKKDIPLFLRQLEGLAIDFLSDFGIKGLRYKGLTGVWIDPVRSKAPEATAPPSAGTSNGVDKKKIASIGIAIRDWITFHGMSINIKQDDLDNFSLIKPCGMDIEMTSLESLLNRGVEIDNITYNLIQKFRDVFESHQEVVRQLSLRGTARQSRSRTEAISKKGLLRPFGARNDGCWTASQGTFLNSIGRVSPDKSEEVISYDQSNLTGIRRRN